MQCNVFYLGKQSNSIKQHFWGGTFLSHKKWDVCSPGMISYGSRMLNHHTLFYVNEDSAIFNPCIPADWLWIPLVWPPYSLQLIWSGINVSMSPSLGRTGQPKAGPVWLVPAQTLCFYSLIPSLAKLWPWAESTHWPWKHIRSQTLHRGSASTSYKLFVSDHLSLFSPTPSMTPSCTVNFASPSRFQRGYFKYMSPALNHCVGTTRIW